MSYYRTYVVFVALRFGDQSRVIIGDAVFMAPMRQAGEDSLQDLDWGLDLISEKTGRRIVSVFVQNEDKHTGNHWYAVVTAPS